MTDCSGYGFSDAVSVCTSGPVGGGNTATLTMDINSSGSNTNFNNQQITIPAWDGSNISVDVTSLLTSDSGFSSANCTSVSANLSLLSQGDGRQGYVLIEYTLDGCSAAQQNYYPQVSENCGGTGPHVISQMQSIYFGDSVICVPGAPD